MKKIITILITLTLLCSYNCKQHSNQVAKVDYKEAQVSQTQPLAKNESYFIYEKWNKINESEEIYQNPGCVIQLKSYLDEAKNIGGKKIYVNNKEIDFIISDAYVFTPFIFVDGAEKILLIQEEDESGIYGYRLYYLDKEKYIKKEYLEIAPEKPLDVDKFIKFKNHAKSITAIILTDKYYDTKLDKIKPSKETLTISKTYIQENYSKDSFNNKVNINSLSFSGIWKAECTTNDHVSNILFYKKDEGELSIYYKTKLIVKMMVEVSSDNKSLKYIGTNIIGEGVDVKKITTLTKGDVLAKIDIINKNKISVNWLDIIKEKIFIKNLFGKENSIILSKCSE
ncbi:hypothetical protein [Chryseobacterium sp. Bi04]|uniref:hypothetical protein n=1 Tax=Chryseobacterium sp. Bi04 TaxID=2822345 RepID=UPI001D94DEC9|nr:hypothetical protein [Chryseobacterium sp. Bi04]CAH0266436.1 hypothetical protein SRABI04_03639 [Chryseobacterium sp. Bi04]